MSDVQQEIRDVLKILQKTEKSGLCWEIFPYDVPTAFQFVRSVFTRARKENERLRARVKELEAALKAFATVEWSFVTKDGSDTAFIHTERAEALSDAWVEAREALASMEAK